MTDTITINTKELAELLNKLYLHFGYCENAFILLENYDSQNDLVLSNGIGTMEKLVELTKGVAEEIWAWLISEQDKADNAETDKAEKDSKPFSNLQVGVPQEMTDNGTIVPLKKMLDAMSEK